LGARQANGRGASGKASVSKWRGGVSPGEPPIREVSSRAIHPSCRASAAEPKGDPDLVPHARNQTSCAALGRSVACLTIHRSPTFSAERRARGATRALTVLIDRQAIDLPDKLTELSGRNQNGKFFQDGDDVPLLWGARIAEASRAPQPELFGAVTATRFSSVAPASSSTAFRRANGVGHYDPLWIRQTAARRQSITRWQSPRPCPDIALHGDRRV